MLLRCKPRGSLGAISVLTGLVAFACASRTGPDFGTLPRVEVPLGSAAQPNDSSESTDEPGGDEGSAAPVGQGGAGGRGPKEPHSSLGIQGGGMDRPDPPPLRLREHAAYVLRFERGELSVDSVRLVSTSHPQPTARRMGRFAFELWRGPQLIERVRFDFPLLGASVPEEEEPLEAGLIATKSIRVPLTRDATQARLVDRKRRSVVEVPWPPDPSSGDSGTAP